MGCIGLTLTAFENVGFWYFEGSESLRRSGRRPGMHIFKRSPQGFWWTASFGNIAQMHFQFNKNKFPQYFCLARWAPRGRKPDPTRSHTIASAKMTFSTLSNFGQCEEVPELHQGNRRKGTWPWASSKAPVPPTQGSITPLNRSWNKRRGVTRKQNSLMSSLDFCSFVSLCAM